MVSQALCQKGKEVINMLDQLKELLDMQRVLDDAILKEHGKVYDETIAEQNEIALFVELGEMMNELEPLFKHWKKKPKYNREKALVEYVDALHFALSLFNHYGYPIKTMGHTYKIKIKEYSIDLEDILNCVRNNASNNLTGLFILGNKLGFIWEEIYNAYKAKNAVNYERLRNGY